MPNRIFDNDLQLSKLLVLYRLRQLDQFAECVLSTGKSLNGAITKHYLLVDSSLTTAQIESLFNTGQTTEETQILADLASARADYKDMPGWSTWTANESVAYINTQTFSGKTKAAVYTEIDGITNITQTKVALKQIVDVVYAFGVVLQSMSKVIIYFRNLIIR